MPHRRVITFQIKRITAFQLYLIFQIVIELNLGFYFLRLFLCIASRDHFIRQINVSTHQITDEFIQCLALGRIRLALGLLFIDRCRFIVYEICEKTLLRLRRNNLTKCYDSLQSILQPLSSHGQTVGQQTIDIFLTVEFKRSIRIILNRVFYRSEQILIVDDISVIFFIAVYTIDAADRLKQIVVVHPFVDIEIGRGRCIEPRKQFIDDNQ